MTPLSWYFKTDGWKVQNITPPPLDIKDVYLGFEVDLDHIPLRLPVGVH